MYQSYEILKKTPEIKQIIHPLMLHIFKKKVREICNIILPTCPLGGMYDLMYR
jgi:hypothetical protein